MVGFLGRGRQSVGISKLGSRELNFYGGACNEMVLVCSYFSLYTGLLCGFTVTAANVG